MNLPSIPPWTPPSPAELASANEGANLMRRAAEVVTEALTGTTPGPWSGYYIPDGSGEVCAAPWKNGYLSGCVMSWAEESRQEYGGEPSDADMAWLCLLNPLIGPPLAELFRHGAEEALEIGPDFRLVNLAKAVLGMTGHPDPETGNSVVTP